MNKTCIKLRKRIIDCMKKGPDYPAYHIQYEVRANTLVLLYIRLGCNMNNLTKEILELGE